MNTLQIIEEVLRLSGPFVTPLGREKHKAWLESKPTDWLEKRRADLQDSNSRNGAAQLRFKFKQRENYAH